MQVDLDFHRIKPELFAQCRSESIDYAVMEKSANIAVVPLYSDWSDVGSWSAMFDIHEMDAFRIQFFCPSQRVFIKRIPAVDN